jgi:nitrile hydratase
MELLRLPSGVHDLGGRDLGPIPGIGQDGERSETVAILNSLWAVFAMNLPQGAFIPMVKSSFERVPKDDYLRLSYFERWAVGMEGLLVENGLLERGAIDARALELAKNPKPHRPLMPSIVPSWPPKTWESPPEQTTRFQVGAQVTAKKTRAAGHSRMPGYVLGKTGTVISIDAQPRPLDDLDENGKLVKPPSEKEPLYKVKFAAKDLWGEAAEPGTDVRVDLWDSYLI